MRRLVCTAVVLLGAGCMAAGPTDPGGDQAAAYRGYANAAKVELARYRTGMVSAGPSTCAGIHNRYELAIRMDLDRMVTLAPDLDALIVAGGGAAVADLECATAALKGELAAHDAVACTYGTIAEDQAEANRHIDAMTAAFDGTIARSEELSAGLAGGPYTWAAASACP